jgi:hypothetical protein
MSVLAIMDSLPQAEPILASPLVPVEAGSKLKYAVLPFDTILKHVYISLEPVPHPVIHLA